MAVTSRKTTTSSRRAYAHVGALICLTLGLLASTFFTVRLAASSGRHQLVYTTQVEQGMTREEALGIAAGAFRGLFVNMLWIRAHNLKQDGKFWEASDLARTITRLQPRFPRAWAFHAWNLAYNISVATQTPRERWQWVNAGIRLLRDEAIPRNPNNMLLHRELSWLYLHKIQQRMDDANNVYKFEFAREWTVVVGPLPERTAQNRERAVFIDQAAQRLEDIASAPRTTAQLTEAFPAAGELYARIKQMGYDLDTALGRMRFLEARELIRATQRRADLLNQATSLESVHPQLIELFVDPDKQTSGLAPLLAHVRRRVLEENYGMEPDRMARFTRKYGPMDWRHPAAHGLYWAAKGVEVGLTRVQDQNRGDFDFINTDRLVIQAIQELYRTGFVHYDILMPDHRFFVQMPAPDFIRSYGEVIDELMKREDEQMDKTKSVDMRQRVFRFYSAGYENFMNDAIVLLYRRGQFEEARQWQVRMSRWEGLNKHDFTREVERVAPLEDYVNQQISDRTSTPSLALQEVYGSLQGAFYNGLLAGDDELFKSQYEYAKRFHKAFMDQQYRITNVDTTLGRQSGVMNPDFRFVAGQILFITMQLIGPVDGSAIFNRAPEEVRPYAYWFIERDLPRDEKGNITADPSVLRLFPEPGGYKLVKAELDEQYRREMQKSGQQELK
jgi:hypothetical protein